MPDYKITIGQVEVIALSDGRVESPTGEFFPSVPSEAWQPYRDYLKPDGKMVANLGAFLVRSDKKTLLVDTGVGPNKQEKRDVVWGLLLDDLRDKGITVDQVDMVVLTHLHRDHVGWNFKCEDEVHRPTFPGARYWVPKSDWEALNDPAGAGLFPHVKEQVLPLASWGLLELMEGEQALTSELTALPTPGHTPGHTSILITSQGEHGLILGDVAHHPAQVHETDWSPFVDVDPEGARTTRRNLFERLERDG